MPNTAALNKCGRAVICGCKEQGVHFKTIARFQSWGGQHEKFSEVVFNSRSNSDGGRRFKRTRVRARRWRGKYSELAGLSAASSGIQAAIVSGRPTVLHPPAQVATSASALTWPCAYRPLLQNRHFSDASSFQLVPSPISRARLQTFKSSLSQ